MSKKVNVLLEKLERLKAEEKLFSFKWWSILFILISCDNDAEVVSLFKGDKAELFVWKYPQFVKRWSGIDARRLFYKKLCAGRISWKETVNFFLLPISLRFWSLRTFWKNAREIACDLGLSL